MFEQPGEMDDPIYCSSMKLTNNVKTDKLDKTTNMYKPCPLSVFNFFIFFGKTKKLYLTPFPKEF